LKSDLGYFSDSVEVICEGTNKMDILLMIFCSGAEVDLTKCVLETILHTFYVYVNAYPRSKAAAFKISDFNGISNLGFVKILEI